jgi:cytochrome c oxidase assembly protein subunit 15
MDSMQPAPAHTRAIARWLMVCICLVVFMVFIGGVTRLTESGLSIVEWKLFSGTLPPLTDTAWAAEFDEYKATPQFQQVNAHFTVGDFKKIYWLEYIHRLLGRVIGLAVLLPFLYFTARRQLPRRLFWRGLAIGGLVAAQGTVGWVMVSSGLVDQPRVAPIKLAAHLLLALSVFCLMLWTRWQVLGHSRSYAAPSLARGMRLVLALVVVQIFFGALVAGLRAGLSYNTYPLMDGQWIPAGLHLMQPWWVNHLESVLAVQFQHRMGALIVVASIIALALRGWKHVSLRPSLKALLMVILVQFTLGVATLISGVNLWLASAHQLVALALLAVLMRLMFLCPLDANQHLTQKLQ